MQYFQAVQQGRQRANKSQIKIFNIAGFGMLTLTTKKKDGNFEPVGEEEYAAVIELSTGDYVAIIVDSEGFTKAQSKAMGKDEAISVYEKLRQTGMPEYPSKHIHIWTETRKTIHNS